MGKKKGSGKGGKGRLPETRGGGEAAHTRRGRGPKGKDGIGGGGRHALKPGEKAVE